MKRNSNYQAVVIGGSAGSIQVLTLILEQLRPKFNLPVIVCLHRMKNVSEGMREVFSKPSANPVVEPNDKDPIEPGVVYIAPSNYHLIIEQNRTFSLSTDELLNFSRPSIDITLQSCSRAYQKSLLGILLTGANRDGVEGMCSVKKFGGTTIVQDPVECAVPFMPMEALKKTCIDHVLSTKGIADFLNALSA